jgi:uncharacterized SAM-binding protein YcdF (DUF218 family)
MNESEQPITDPADLINLIGRFVLTLVLNVLIVLALLRREWVSVGVLSLVSLYVHRVTILLWRRLRDERVEALAQKQTQKQKGAV